MEQINKRQKFHIGVAVVLFLAFLTLLGFLNFSYGLSSSSLVEKPVIQKLQYEPESPDQTGGSYVVSASAVKGETYELLQKEQGLFHSYEVVDTQTAKDDTVKLTAEQVSSSEDYTYKVRVQQGPKSEAVKTLEAVSSVKVKVENLNADLSWSPVEGANAYTVYRKLGTSGEWCKIATVEETAYSDVYAETFSEDEAEQYLDGKYRAYLDPSKNCNIYAVSARYLPEDEEASCKQGIAFSGDGVFTLQTPAISTVNLLDEQGEKIYTKDLADQTPVSATVSWKEVPNATGYYVYKGHEKGNSVSFERILDTAVEADAEVYDYRTTVTESNGEASTDENAVTNTVTVPYDAENPYFTVEAYYTGEDGKTVVSDRDETFTVENRAYSDVNVLYMGDSIAYGSPYTNQATGYQYSFPFRVQQLLGVNAYNASIPGATLANKQDADCRHLVTSALDQLKQGKTPNCSSGLAMKENDRSLADFDIIVLEAGANDYARNVELGDPDSYDKSTFYGALNTTMAAIEEASTLREEQGKDPIKVVFIDLFYSEKDNSEITVPASRLVTVNKEQLTYEDYQEAMNTVYDNWDRESDLTLYQFHTGDYGFLSETTIGQASTDNLHLTAQTYSVMGSLFADFLRETVF